VGCAKELFVSVIQHTFASISESAVIVITDFLRHQLPYLLTYLRTYSFIYLFTAWSRVLLEKLTGSQLLKKFPAFYRTRKFTALFTIARHLSIS